MSGDWHDLGCGLHRARRPLAVCPVCRAIERRALAPRPAPPAPEPEATHGRPPLAPPSPAERATLDADLRAQGINTNRPTRRGKAGRPPCAEWRDAARRIIAGERARDVASAYGVAKSTVWFWVTRYRNELGLARGPRQRATA